MDDLETRQKAVQADQAVVKELIINQDRTLLLKANKTALIEQEIVNKATALAIEKGEQLTAGHALHLRELVKDIEKVGQQIELIKYTVSNEIRSVVKRQFQKLQNDPMV